MMPKLSVWMVRSALVCMGIGFLFGSLVLHHKGVPIYLWTWRLLPPHIELMIFGWTVQLAMGVGFWILPRFPQEDRYGNTALAWIAFFFFDAGLLVSAWAGYAAHGGMQVAGRGAMLVGVLIYVWVMWPRIRAFGAFAASPPRTGEDRLSAGTTGSRS
jgi:hypothetical protein